MTSLLTVTRETIVLLRRDNIFIPLIFVTLLMFWFAQTASLWSIYEVHKFVFDISFAAIHISGALAAVYWSTKVFADSRQDGSVEMLMAAPVKRSTVILGRFFGMAFVLTVYNLLLTLALQLVAIGPAKLDWFSIRELLTCLFYLEAWLVLAAVGVMFASIGGQTTALFCTVVVWFMGMTSQGFALAIKENQPEFTRLVVGMFSKIWNLQAFNLAKFVGVETFLSSSELWSRFAYGLTIIAIALTIATVMFQRRDAT